MAMVFVPTDGLCLAHLDNYPSTSALQTPLHTSGLCHRHLRGTSISHCPPHLTSKENSATSPTRFKTPLRLHPCPERGPYFYNLVIFLEPSIPNKTEMVVSRTTPSSPMHLRKKGMNSDEGTASDLSHRSAGADPPGAEADPRHDKTTRLSD
ncbi:hypothetical protein DPEC_G00188250 [Dallia pectoralis]|uniref:Uncharacterized protein n=1 Tax=Dallia pectoralis TaxID=75939 RepID=A0ACC2GCF4_DALPE|nr:hypothetical protein DPEC_G00188250 [Dallia pectoralis]